MFNNGKPLKGQKWTPIYDGPNDQDWIQVGTHRRLDILCIKHTECCGDVCCFCC